VMIIGMKIQLTNNSVLFIYTCSSLIILIEILNGSKSVTKFLYLLEEHRHDR
jgi:hypothetical protein